MAAGEADHHDVAMARRLEPEGGTPAEDEAAIAVGRLHARALQTHGQADMADETVGDGGDDRESQPEAAGEPGQQKLAEVLVHGYLSIIALTSLLNRAGSSTGEPSARRACP